VGLNSKINCDPFQLLNLEIPLFFTMIVILLQGLEHLFSAGVDIKPDLVPMKFLNTKSAKASL
jgi:hypothetical protein